MTDRPDLCDWIEAGQPYPNECGRLLPCDRHTTDAEGHPFGFTVHETEESFMAAQPREEPATDFDAGPDDGCAFVGTFMGVDQRCDEPPYSPWHNPSDRFYKHDYEHDCSEAEAAPPAALGDGFDNHDAIAHEEWAAAHATERPDARSQVAAWMMEHGFATGHGDTLADLLAELSWQVKERKEGATIPAIGCGNPWHYERPRTERLDVPRLGTAMHNIGLTLADNGGPGSSLYDVADEYDRLSQPAATQTEPLDVKRLAYAMSGCDGVNWPKRWEPEDFAWVARQIAASYRRLSPPAATQEGE